MRRNCFLRVPQQWVCPPDEPGGRTRRECVDDTAACRRIGEVLLWGVDFLQGRLGECQQLGIAARQLQDVVDELEWGWRRLPVYAPTHPDDVDLRELLHRCQQATLHRLENTLPQLAQIQLQLADLLGVDPLHLDQLQQRAEAGVAAILSGWQPAPLISPECRVALLAVVCDSVAAPSSQNLARLLGLAERLKLVAPALVADVDLDPAPKRLVAASKDVYLLLEEADLESLDEICAALSLTRNRFALHALACWAENRDLHAEMVLQALLAALIAVDNLIHAALACAAAAGQAADQPGSDVTFQLHTKHAAWQVFRRGNRLLRLLAGAGCHWHHHFMPAIQPLQRSVVKAFHQGIGSAAAPAAQTTAILRYLAALRLLPPISDHCVPPSHP